MAFRGSLFVATALRPVGQLSERADDAVRSDSAPGGQSAARAIHPDASQPESLRPVHVKLQVILDHPRISGVRGQRRERPLSGSRLVGPGIAVSACAYRLATPAGMKNAVR